MENNFILLILIPLVTAFLLPIIELVNTKIRKAFILLSASGELLLGIIIFISNYNLIKTSELYIEYNLGAWSSFLGIALVLDNLSLFFSILLVISMFLIIVYSIGFIGHQEGKYYVLLFLLLAAMQGAVLTNDIFNLYVFIELITITSTALISFNRNRESAEASFKYLLYGVIGGLFFFIGIFLLYYTTGSLNMGLIFSEYQDINQNIQIAVMILFLTSIFIKVGLFPFHYWLPKAHSTSTGPVSALLSGILLKVFICIFLRLFWQVFSYELLVDMGLAELIIYIGLFSSIIGHLLAFREDDIKRMLAFSTLGHIGMIVAVLALNTASGLLGGLMHTISHLLMKSTLFLTVGYLLQYTEGSHHLADFNGIAYKNKGIFVSFILAALGMVGIPPLPGFFSKWYIVDAFIQSGYNWAALLILLLGLISLFYYLRYIIRGYNQVEAERIVKPVKETSVLSVFYRERVVTLAVYVFTTLMLTAGLFFWWYKKPLLIIANLITG